jgi:hypothetical protein
MRVLGAVVLMGVLAGCGHEVEPTADYADPARVPVCCLSDPSAACCGLDGVAYPAGIVLTWNAEDAVFGVVDGWILLRASGDEAPPESAYVRLNAQLLTFREFVDEDIDDGVRYWYRLRSRTPAGVTSLPTLPAVIRADFTPPDPPAGLSASVSEGRVQLAWDASPAPDLAHYNVYRAPDFPPFIFPRTVVPSYQDPEVEADSTYRYWVTAVDAALNESAPGDTVAVTIP